MRAARRAAWLAPTLALAQALGPGVATAGPPEELVSLVLHPEDPQIMALRFVQGGDGLFVTRDGGQSWALLCGSAIDRTLTRTAALALVGGGSLLLAGEVNEGGGNVFNSLWEDDGTACGWSRVDSLFGRWVTDFAQHPTDPAIAFAITGDGAPTSQNGLWRREPSGAWAALGAQEPVILGRLRVVDVGGALRFYESASRGTHDPPDGGAIGEPKFLIRVSDDEGATWQEHPYPVTDGSLRLLAIDPTNPDRILAVVARPEVPTHPPEEDLDEIVLSTDRGATFSDYLVVSEIGGAVIAPDGRVWIGDRGSTLLRDVPQGLWMAPSLAEAPRKIGGYPVACLGLRESDTLFACQWTSFGRVAADGTFEDLFDFTTAKAMLECPGKDMAEVCEPQLCRAYCGLGHFPRAPLCAVYDGPLCGPCVVDSSAAACNPAPAAIDAGTPDAGDGGCCAAPTADAGAQSASDSGCSCRVGGRERTGSTSALGPWLLALAALGARPFQRRSIGARVARARAR